MFIYSFKMNKRKLVAVIGAVIIAVVLGIVLIGSLVKKDGDSEVYKNSSSSVSASEEADVLVFIQSFGWEVTQKPMEIKQVAIPYEFNDTYEKYNAIQLSQGYDLTKLKGETVTKYTYEVKNYPERPYFIRANVLVYKDEVVGGDVCSISLSGFMHGFEIPEDTETNSIIESTKIDL